jgi:DNA-binding transcriptional LysR family regulator
MELRHLRYFVAVAEELHFSRAAAKLNIATPTLSAQIRSLEALLGAQLFVRQTRSVALTHVGRRFLDEARATLRQADQAEQVGRRAARGEVGTIVVGYIYSAVCGGSVGRSIAHFRAKHPGVMFELRRVSTIGQMNALIDGTLDVGFTRTPDRYPTGLAGFLIDRQALCVALPASHPLAARAKIAPEMLAGEPLIATSLEMEVGFGSNLGDVTTSASLMHVVARGADPFSVITLVSAGIGLGVLSDSIKRVAIPGVVFRPLTKTSRFADHAVVYRTNESGPVVKAFIASLKERTRDVPATPARRAAATREVTDRR